MHEMGVALQIIEIAKNAVPPEMKRLPVSQIHLRIGQLSAIVVDSLKFCFEVAARETPLAGAELTVEEVPVTARCKECGHEWTIREAVFVCRRCRSGAVQVIFEE